MAAIQDLILTSVPRCVANHKGTKTLNACILMLKGRKKD